MNTIRLRSAAARPIPNQGSILYWMSRDQRTRDNWALLYAQQCAIEARVPLIVCFCLAPRFLDAARAQYEFMLKGLRGVGEQLREHAIPFLVRTEPSDAALATIIDRYSIGLVVTDFSPIRLRRRQVESAASAIRIPLVEVDAHNIVPVWHASVKQEFGAYTLRPRLNRLLPEFLDDFPDLVRHPFPPSHPVAEPDWIVVERSVTAAPAQLNPELCASGEDAAREALKYFLSRRLSSYHSDRNDPVLDAQSHLSPYLHFGQISAQRIALEVLRHAASHAEDAASAQSFLEELIVRRELADNFCFYNERYDAFDGFPAWAQRTLNEHRHDARPHCYEIDALEQAQTHDALWNAAQRQMMSTGRMHGYMRMYWSKKILEWTRSPEEAMASAIYLNDRYELDGRDPNGYAGIAWSIGGVHDRAWAERPIYGKIRYMNAAGCARKFDVKKYMARYSGT
ncbi:MAG: deoxyribodipyrimidine photo-lyase [Acidobacteriota bacterium]